MGNTSQCDISSYLENVLEMLKLRHGSNYTFTLVATINRGEGSDGIPVTAVSVVSTAASLSQVAALLMASHNDFLATDPNYAKRINWPDGE